MEAVFLLAVLAGAAWLVLIVLLVTGRMYRKEPRGFPLDEPAHEKRN